MDSRISLDPLGVVYVHGAGSHVDAAILGRANGSPALLSGSCGSWCEGRQHGGGDSLPI
jgi:hypothetical protein